MRTNISFCLTSTPIRFGTRPTLVHYEPYYLFVHKITDAMGNVVAIADDNNRKPRFDYRVLAPIEMVDANGNHSEVRIRHTRAGGGGR